MRKAFDAQISLLIILLVGTVVPTFGQVATGTPPFGSFGGGPDLVNLANLNAHIAVPIVNKAGRGLPFEYAYSYDTSVWYPATVSGTLSWVPVANWGWRGETEAATGYISYTETVGSCLNSHGVKSPAYSMTNWVYHDSFGIPHTFPGSRTEVLDCTHVTTTFTGTTSDGSGYTLNASGFTGTISGRDGKSITAPINVTSGSALAVDRNGNEITATSTGVFTDTLGTTALTIATGTLPNPTTLTYSASGGQAVKYTINYSQLTVQTNFACSGVAEFGPTSEYLISSIQLPDNTEYKFQYEQTPGHTTSVTGRLASLTLPTGGKISYSYGGGSNGVTCSDGTAATLTRTTPDGAWVYAHSENGTSWTTTVTDPQSNQTALSFQGIYETQRLVYQSGTLTQTVSTCYNGSASPCTSTAITLPIAKRTVLVKWPGTANLESSSTTSYNSFGLVTEKDEYAYGSGSIGSLARKSLITYANIGNGIVDMPGSVIVENGSGAIVAQANYTYDSAPLTLVSGIAQHDDQTYGTSRTARGNLTKLQNLISSAAGYLTVSATYDTTGQRLASTDAALNTTTFSYADSYFTDNGANPPQSAAPGAPTNAFVTKVTYPIIGVGATFGYYLDTGETAVTTDANGANAYTHFDSQDRISTEFSPMDPSGNRGWTLIQYPGSSGTEVDTYTGIGSTTPSASCTSCRHGQRLLDSQGRPTSDVLVSDPDGATTAVTLYDALGRVKSKTNPYRSTSDPTYGVETPTYDVLGRMTAMTHSDGSVGLTDYGTTAVGAAGGITSQLCSTSTYGFGYPTLTIDPSGKRRESWTDALGRTIEVDEPDSSGNLTQSTCTLFDTGNNPIQIVQGTQTRTYSYDGLSRLTASSSPETGAKSYFYTSSTGSLCSGSALLICRRTDARGITATNTYDTLNRITSMSYSDGTPSVNYFYDQTSYNGLTINDGKGRLTGMSDGSGQSAFSYDLLGRISSESHTISGVSKNLSYVYNLDNSLKSITYPSGRQITYSYSNAERTVGVVDSGTAVNYATSAIYAPPGSLSSIVFGESSSFGGITMSDTYNNRLQLIGQQASSSNGSVLNLSYGYPGAPGNNSRVTSVANNLDSGRSESIAYDPLNRISSAQSQATAGADCWGQGLGYDRWGNLLSISVTKCTGSALSVSVANNQITNTGYSYDAAGDMTNDSSYAYTFDAEERLSSANGVTYTYDGRDMRVKKSSGTLYWRGFIGDAVSETTLSGSVTSDYVFFDGMRIARIDASGNVYYYFSDKVGSARAITTSGGSVCYSADFTPFGQELNFTNTCPQNYKFATYERDLETQLDYAFFRQYSARLGRFLQPDALGGTLRAPQSLNRYAYALNDPCTLTDPLGLAPCILNIAVNNNTNLTQNQMTALQNQINALFGPDVQASFNFSGAAQYTLNVSTAPPGTSPETFGESGNFQGSNFVYSDNVTKAFSLSSPVHQATIMGTVGAHELVHAITNIGDIPFDRNTPTDLMSQDHNPSWASQRNLLNHGSLRLTDTEKRALLAKCQAHPNSPNSNRPSAQMALGDGGLFVPVVVEIATQNSSVTVSQQQSLPTPCTDGTFDGCTVVANEDVPTDASDSENDNGDNGDNGDSSGQDDGDGKRGDDGDSFMQSQDCGAQFCASGYANRFLSLIPARITWDIIETPSIRIDR